MPNLHIDWYIGRKVIAVTRGKEPWQWGIKLEGDVEFRNKDETETFRPMEVVNYVLKTISQSLYDTTFYFTHPDKPGFVKVSFPPTKWVVYDPRYGNEIYAQWPEELDEMGVTANEGKALPNPQPSPEWEPEKARLVEVRAQRVKKDAADFMADTEEP